VIRKGYVSDARPNVNDYVTLNPADSLAVIHAPAATRTGLHRLPPELPPGPRRSRIKGGRGQKPVKLVNLGVLGL